VDSEKGVFLVGGSVQPDRAEPGSGIGGFQIEVLLVGGGGDFRLLDVASMVASRNVFFAAAAQYVEFRLVVGGGLVRDADGTFRPALLNSGRAPVFIFSTENGPNGAITSRDTDGPPMELGVGGRMFGAAAALPDQRRAIFVGGWSAPGNFSDFSMASIDGLDLFDENTILVTPIEVNREARTLRQTRGGLSATAVGDGTIVVIGGTSEGGPLETAEIFADPANPPNVAGVNP
jgi:hypothetical protein